MPGWMERGADFLPAGLSGDFAKGISIGEISTPLFYGKVFFLPKSRWG